MRHTFALVTVLLLAGLVACAASPEATNSRQDPPSQAPAPSLAEGAVRFTLVNVEFELRGPWGEAPEFLVEDVDFPPEKILWVPGVSDTEESAGFPFVSCTVYSGPLAGKGFARYLADPNTLVERTRGRFDPDQGYKPLSVQARPELGMVVHSYEIIDVVEERLLLGKIAAVETETGMIEVEYFGRPTDVAWQTAFDAMLAGIRRFYRL